MTDPNDSSVERIRKLLAKAEAKGVSDEERDAYNAKAAELMIKYAIDEALLNDTGRAITEKIVYRTFRLNCPKTYSYEYTTIGCGIARALGSQGLTTKQYDNRVDLTIVGFETDIDYVWQLTESLVRQCTLALGVWYAANVRPWHDGTAKFQMKRSFILGFGAGARDKIKAMKQQIVEDAGTSTALAIRTRESQVTDWINNNLKTRTSTRRYEGSSRAGGYGAGQRADVGGARIGGVRKQIGG